MSQRRAPGERGQAAIELVGIVFLTVLIAVLAVQSITVAQAASITQEAARNGARALSQGENWKAVVEQQVPDGLDLKVRRADLDRHTAHVRVTVSAPLGLAGMEITDVTITRTADFPVEQRRRGED